MASEPCTLTSERRPESTASISAQTRPYCDGLGALAAVALQVHAEHAERAELLGQLAGRQRAVLEPLADVRAQPVVGELAHGVAQQAVLVVEVVVEVEQIQAVQRVAHARHATPHAVTRADADYPACHARTAARSTRSNGPGSCGQQHWPGRARRRSTPSMRAVTSIMRAHQILIAELDAMLRPFGITFSRYEALVLLVHSPGGRAAAVEDRRAAAGARDVGDQRRSTGSRPRGWCAASRTRATAAARWPSSPTRGARWPTRPPRRSTPPASGWPRSPGADLDRLFDDPAHRRGWPPGTSRD